MNLKTPITYYGGKQRLLKYILPLIPEHITYTEAFAGGLAVFFAKQKAEVEVVNDMNGELVNFYKVLKINYKELKLKIDATMHSRTEHDFATIVYKYAQFFDKITRAWALWVLSRQSFASRLDGCWGYDVKKNHKTKAIKNAKINFGQEFCERLENTQIENNDALKIIKSRDTENTFHFIDPPYVGSDQGHYKGYTESDFTNLLDLVSTIKGKFMLTMFPHEILTSYTKKNKWKVHEIERTISASKVSRRRQIELIVTNY